MNRQQRYKSIIKKSTERRALRNGIEFAKRKGEIVYALNVGDILDLGNSQDRRYYEIKALRNGIRYLSLITEKQRLAQLELQAVQDGIDFNNDMRMNGGL